MPAAVPNSAAVSEIDAPRPAPEPARDESGAVQAPERASAELPASARETEDWLGQQLSLIARARPAIVAGQFEAGLRVLDEYEARFPEGVLEVQLDALRKRAYERRRSIILP